MRFSEAFNVVRGDDDDWFDPHLTIDTQLFLDPVLLIVAGEPWTEAHKELIDHFEFCFKLIASSDGRRSTSGKLALRLLEFPEPADFCLGYTSDGTSGAGTAKGGATRMADGIAVAIAHGLQVPEHIEEIGILNEGIGADRISDAVCNVLKSRFIKYTQDVCRRHDIPMEERKIKNGSRVLEHGRWMHPVERVPINPYSGDPVLLVPERLLNDLPALNADDWFDDNLNDDIRTALNLKVGQRATKSQIVEVARRNPVAVRQWANAQQSRPDLASYRFDDDPRGVFLFDQAPLAFARSHVIGMGFTRPTTPSQLVELVREICEQFRHFIEERGGWQLLWNDAGDEKPESAAQLVFMAMAGHHLRLFGVEVDREVNLGRGPVDFKVSAGTEVRLVIEVKKVHNGKFWNGLESQLTSYMTSDNCDHGWFLAIRYRDTKSSNDRVSLLPRRIRQVSTQHGSRIESTIVDARPKTSASKI